VFENGYSTVLIVFKECMIYELLFLAISGIEGMFKLYIEGLSFKYLIILHNLKKLNVNVKVKVKVKVKAKAKVKVKVKVVLQKR